MLSLVKSFRDEIAVNGISKDSVKLLEDSLGDKIITSIYPIGGLTTESSSNGVEDIMPILDDYIETNKKKPKRNLNQLLLLHSDILSHVSRLLEKVNVLAKTYSTVKKETALNMKEFYTFEQGEEVAYNLIYSDSKIQNLFSSYSLDRIIDCKDENKQARIKSAIEFMATSPDARGFNVLVLFIWKDNSFYEFLCGKNILFNPEPTIKQLFSSLDGLHMIKEDLERTLTYLDYKWRDIVRGHSINLFSNEYDVWADMLKCSSVSYASIDLLTAIFDNIE